MNLPIGLGDQDRMEYYFARTTDVVHHTLKETPRGHLAAKIATTLDWDEDAMQGLMQIPPPVRPMVTEQVETYAKGKGAERRDAGAHGRADGRVRHGPRGHGAVRAARRRTVRAGPPGALSTKEQSILSTANALDPEVTFTVSAAVELTGVPRPFLKKALDGIVRKAKAEGVTVVDAAFVQRANAERRS